MVAGAVYCKDCGGTLAGSQRLVHARDYNPVTAALLSIVPGLGHLYRGKPGRAVIWFFVVIVAYSLGPIGYLIHLACCANAALSGSVQPVPRGAGRRARQDGAM
jgi:TM2 domain-containing membrane protein YozV